MANKAQKKSEKEKIRKEKLISRRKFLRILRYNLVKPLLIGQSVNKNIHLPITEAIQRILVEEDGDWWKMSSESTPSSPLIQGTLCHVCMREKRKRKKMCNCDKRGCGLFWTMPAAMHRLPRFMKIKFHFIVKNCKNSVFQLFFKLGVRGCGWPLESLKVTPVQQTNYRVHLTCCRNILTLLM